MQSFAFLCTDNRTFCPLWQRTPDSAAGGNSVSGRLRVQRTELPRARLGECRLKCSGLLKVGVVNVHTLGFGFAYRSDWVGLPVFSGVTVCRGWNAVWLALSLFMPWGCGVDMTCGSFLGLFSGSGRPPLRVFGLDARSPV